MKLKHWLVALAFALAPLSGAQADHHEYDYYYGDYYDDGVYGDTGWEYEWFDGWEYETTYGEWEYEDTWNDGYWEFEDDWWK